MAAARLVLRWCVAAKRSLEHHLVQLGVGECEASIGEAVGDDAIGPRRRDARCRLPELLETFAVERIDETAEGAELGVHDLPGDADRSGDAAHGDPGGAFLAQELDGRRQHGRWIEARWSSSPGMRCLRWHSMTLS